MCDNGVGNFNTVEEKFILEFVPVNSKEQIVVSLNGFARFERFEHLSISACRKFL